MQKLNTPLPLRAASLTLTSALQTVVGTVSSDCANATSGAIKLGALAAVVIGMAYTRNAGSTTGRPSIVVDMSLDAPDTAPASVSNWQPLYILDGASFSAGAVQTYPEAQQPNPTASGTTVFGTHILNVSVAQWVRVRVVDVDTANPGSIANVRLGGCLP